MKLEIEKQLNTYPTEHWLHLLGKAGVPCAPINNVAQALEDAQINFRNMVIETLDPDAGQLRMAGNPIKLSAFEDPTTREPAPNLDQNRTQILNELKDKRT